MGRAYVLFLETDGTVKSSTKINTPFQNQNEFFGNSLVSLGDADGDGITELAVGSVGRVTGAVDVFRLNADGTTSGRSGIGPFGMGTESRVITSLGDLDGNGTPELAVFSPLGHIEDLDVGPPSYLSSGVSSIQVVFTNPAGSVASTTEILEGTEEIGDFGDGEIRSLTSLGDLDGDGVTDIAVGAQFADRSGIETYCIVDVSDPDPETPCVSETRPKLDTTDGTGAVYVLFMNTDGTVKNSQKIAHNTGGMGSLPSRGHFGRSVAALGDLDGDGVTDLAVTSPRHREAAGCGIISRGGIHLLFLEELRLGDLGDAPDTGAGTGPWNYNTLASHNGPVPTCSSGHCRQDLRALPNQHQQSAGGSNRPGQRRRSRRLRRHHHLADKCRGQEIGEDPAGHHLPNQFRRMAG